jgi:hypothetical protein
MQCAWARLLLSACNHQRPKDPPLSHKHPQNHAKHLYGCSEHCSIISGLEIVAGPGAADALASLTALTSRLPVGTARAGVSIHVLDPETLQPVPKGDVGEVSIS